MLPISKKLRQKLDRFYHKLGKVGQILSKARQKFGQSQREVRQKGDQSQALVRQRLIKVGQKLSATYKSKRWKMVRQLFSNR